MSDITRITGMVTGLDTDELVKKMVSLEQTKIDNEKQDKQYTEWKQEAYREMINLFREFKDEHFNYLKGNNNMRSATALNSYQVTYNGSDTSRYLDITATRESTFANYPITEVTTAKRAEATGVILAGSIEGNSVPSASISSIEDNNKITVTLNGVSKVITIDDGLSGLTEIKENLQTKINTSFGTEADGSAKVIVSLNNTNDGFVFSTEKTNTLSLNYAYNDGFDTFINKDLSEGSTIDYQNNKFELSLTDSSSGTTEPITNTIALTPGDYTGTADIISETQTQIDSLFGADTIRVLNKDNRIVFNAVGSQGTATGLLADNPVSDPVDIVAGNNDTLEITIDGTAKTITIDEGTYTKDELLVAIQTELDESFGTGKTMVSLNDLGELRFEGINTDKIITASKEENGGLAELGFDADSVNKSNKVELGTNLDKIKMRFNTAFTGSDTDEDGYDIEFSINGEDFSFDSAITSLDDIIDEVNSNDKVNVIMKYDELNDYITVETKDTGVTTTLNIEDTVGEGNLMAVLGLDGTASIGSDAVVKFVDGTADGLTITRETNTFTVDGLGFDLKEDFIYDPLVADSADSPIDIAIDTDTTKSFEVIKGFVEKYNEVITKINEELTEKQYRSYRPLTESQKEEMSEKEIELWEEKAKSGILRSEPILEKMLYSMRSALYQEVEGANINLFDLGIETSSNYLDGGKLTLDEEKLKSALRDKPEEVVELFTASGDSFETRGLSHRLYNIMQENIRTTRDEDGYKGTLLEKAGVEGDISEFDNLLSDKMDDYDERIEELIDDMSEKEDHYYNMFARMEAAISRMNNQSSWLMSQMGMGGGAQ